MSIVATPERAGISRISGLSLLALWLMGMLAISLVYLEGQQSIKHTAQLAVMEEARQVTQQVERQLGQAQAALDALGSADLSPALNWNDPKASETRAWKVLLQHRQVAQLHWANNQGQLFEIEPLYSQGEFKALVAHRDDQTGGRQHYLASQPLDRRERVSEDSVSYDLFLQAWWRTAVEQAAPSERSVWSTPQVNVLRKDLSMFLSQAFVDAATPSQTLGVVAVQVPLQSLKPILSNGKLMPQALIYLTNNQGMLLASSEAVDTYKLEGGVPKLVEAKQSELPMLSQASSMLAQADVSQGSTQREWRSLHDEGLLIHEQPIRASAGLVWKLVIVVPLSALTSQLVRSSLLAAALFTATAVLLAWWINRRLRKSTIHTAGNLDQTQSQLPALNAAHENTLKIQMQQQETELQALRQTRDQFVAEASHDLNTPLHALKTASTLLSGTVLSLEQRELVSTLASASLQLQHAQRRLFSKAQALDEAVQQPNAVQSIELDSSVAQQWPLRILLVDDNSTNLKIGHLLLKRLGYEVKSALDGQQAVNLVRQGFDDNAAFDLVLMDMQMPVMDGMQASLAIMALSRERHLPSPCLVALSANALAAQREHALAAGLDEYLSKPIELDQLHRVLEMAYLRIAARPAPASAASALTTPIEVKADTAAMVDFKRLDQLAQYDTDGSLIRDALADFHEQLPLTVQTIVQAFNQHDYEAARQAAHKIKGSAGNLGATVLSRCAHQLELSAQQSDAAAVEKALPELERIAEMTLESLRKRYH